MKKILLSTLLIIATSAFIFAQEKDSLETTATNNSVSIELGGSSIFYSVNYEHNFPISQLVRLNLGVGLSFIRVDFWYPVNVITIPIKFGIIAGRNRNKFEAGIGFTQAFADKDPLFVPNTFMNYRFEGKKGFLFTSGLVGGLIIEKFSDKTHVDPIVWPKIGFGYSF